MDNDGAFFWGGYRQGRFWGFAQDWYTVESRVILLKGGAGTGKSTLMRRVRERWESQGQKTFSFRCASDPDSLDAVCTADRRLCIMDATAPHAVEARFPSAVERLLDLGAALDGDRLRAQLPQLAQYRSEQQAFRLRAGQYLRAAAVLAEREADREDELPSERALLRCADRLSRHLFDGEQGDGTDVRAYLTGITPDGEIALYDTMTALCPRIFVLEGDAPVAARLMALLRHRAAMAGVSTISCPCALRPNCIEHLLIPDADTAFTVSNPHHAVDFPVYRRLSMERYREKPLTATARRRRRLFEQTQGELLAEGMRLLAAARECHRREEEIYGAAMCWEKADEMLETAWEWLQ